MTKINLIQFLDQLSKLKEELPVSSGSLKLPNLGLFSQGAAMAGIASSFPWLHQAIRDNADFEAEVYKLSRLWQQPPAN